MERGSFVDDHFGADPDVLSEVVDFFVGHGDAPFGPVDFFVDGEFLFGGDAESVDADMPAEFGVLGRRPVVFDGGCDVFEFVGADNFIFVAVPSIKQVGVVNLHEEVEFAVVFEVDNFVDAERCFFVTAYTFCAFAAFTVGDRIAFNDCVAVHDAESLFGARDDKVVLCILGKRVVAGE